MKLNIGCGPNWRNYPDYEGVDKVDFGQPYILDIEQILPWDSATIEEIICNHTLEHTLRYVNVIQEMARILIPNGLLKITVPGQNNPKYHAFGHYNFFTKTTWETMRHEWYDIPLRIESLIENSRGDIHVWLKKLP